MLDEVCYSVWFNESRRIESVKAHTALGGQLVHGCQSVPNQSGGEFVGLTPKAAAPPSASY